MAALKHIGRMKHNRRKVAVAYRTIPNEPYSAVVVTTENLMADEHDALIKLIESPAGQQANELADAMGRTQLPDGRNMLAGFHTTGKMIKVKTDEVEMTPDTSTTIPLNELNEIVAQQKGVAIEDLAIQSGKKKADKPASVEEAVTDIVEDVTMTTEDVITDEQLAAQYRSQADALFKEAKSLREQAEELVPTKRKSKKTEESA
jgi:hypothetical protein